MKIPFNRPPYTGNEDAYVLEAMRSGKISGDGPFGLRCQEWFRRRLGCAAALMVPSCTQALEMAAMLADLRPGDEVIMPSFTFVSTANAFVRQGASPVFVDVRPDTLNLDERLIEQAITPRTKAIVPVHYAGVGCEMTPILEIARRHDLLVIEDAAQGMLSAYEGRDLGRFGNMAAYSFHETKNYTSGGEGGLLIVNDPRFAERAEIIREKGTNRKLFLRGMVDKYTWVDQGSSYLPGELQCAYLWGQLEIAERIREDRLRSWDRYRASLAPLMASGRLELPTIPANRAHNGHLFHLKVRDLEERTALLRWFTDRSILAVFHYVPLHSSPAGLKWGRLHGEDRHTTRDSERLVRLPLWHGMGDAVIDEVVQAVDDFFAR